MCIRDSNDTQESGERLKINGFDRFNQYNFGMSIGTTVYGLFNFKETSKIQSIRHVIRPSISYNIDLALKNITILT